MPVLLDVDRRGCESAEKRSFRTPGSAAASHAGSQHVDLATWSERVEQLLADRASRSGASIEAESAKITAAIPLQRMGTLEEFGKTVAWLASPAASYIHGHALMFDGGMVKAAL